MNDDMMKHQCDQFSIVNHKSSLGQPCEQLVMSVATMLHMVHQCWDNVCYCDLRITMLIRRWGSSEYINYQKK